MATALVQLDNGVRRQCNAWSTIAGSAVTQLVITSSNDPTAQADAARLFDLLDAMLRRHYATPEPAQCGGGFGPGADGCWASSHSGAVRRVLVWIGDATASPPFVNVVAASHWPWSVVLPVLPRGAVALPPAVAHNVVRHYRPGNVDEVLPDVMVQAGLDVDAFRVFISYRWHDSRAFADQLFNALSEAQFDVYLDRFRTTPGTNFVDRIQAELADKACVVVLDSANVAQSPWVAQEYAIARKYRLGLMAIDLPGGVRTFPRIGSRLDLRAAKPAAFTGGTRLSRVNVDTAVAFIRNRYFPEISRRFRYQRKVATSAAQTAGVTAAWGPDGLLEIIGARRYFASVCARPPRVENFGAACTAATGVATPVVIGPLHAPMHREREEIRWLAQATRSVIVDESRLYKAMRHARRGKL